MNYREIDLSTYYRAGVFTHFTKDCRCSVSMTARVDVTDLRAACRGAGARFHTAFLYLLGKVMNAREDYRMAWRDGRLICYDRVHPTAYVFHEDTETCTPVYLIWDPDWDTFRRNAEAELARAAACRDYLLDAPGHPNWFDASAIPWVSYDSLHVELPDGNLFFSPILNWGRWREEDGRLMLPLTVRMNHAVADGYLIARVFRLLEQEMAAFAEALS